MYVCMYVHLYYYLYYRLIRRNHHISFPWPICWERAGYGVRR
jgi:hypothetical protein